MIKFVSTPPGAEVMTADDVRPFLRIDDDTAEETAVINRLIAAARLQVEHDAAVLLQPQIWTVRRMYWPREPYIILPCVPARTVEELAYTTDSGRIVIDPVEYVLESIEDRYTSLVLVRGAWPTLPLRFPGLVCSFGCGYETVPEDLAEAMRSLVAYWYDNREAAIASTAYKAEVSVLPLRYQEIIAARRPWTR